MTCIFCCFFSDMCCLLGKRVETGPRKRASLPMQCCFEFEVLVSKRFPLRTTLLLRVRLATSKRFLSLITACTSSSFIKSRTSSRTLCLLSLALLASLREGAFGGPIGLFPFLFLFSFPFFFLFSCLPSLNLLVLCLRCGSFQEAEVNLKCATHSLVVWWLWCCNFNRFDAC